MFDVSVEDVGYGVVLRCAGRMVRGEETAILCAALGVRGRDITVDMSGVETIDSAGVGALLSLQAAGVYVRLSEPSQAVRQFLQVRGMESVFEIQSSADCGVAVAQTVFQVNDSAICAGDPSPRW